MVSNNIWIDSKKYIGGGGQFCNLSTIIVREDDTEEYIRFKAKYRRIFARSISCLARLDSDF